MRGRARSWCPARETSPMLFAGDALAARTSSPLTFLHRRSAGRFIGSKPSPHAVPPAGRAPGAEPWRYAGFTAYLRWVTCGEGMVSITLRSTCPNSMQSKSRVPLPRTTGAMEMVKSLPVRR